MPTLIKRGSPTISDSLNTDYTRRVLIGKTIYDKRIMQNNMLTTFTTYHDIYDPSLCLVLIG